MRGLALAAAAAAASCSSEPSSPGSPTGRPTAVTIAPADTSIPQGATAQVRTAITDSAGNAIGGLRPALASSDTSVVTVTPLGIVHTGSHAGSATITASFKELAGPDTLLFTALSRVIVHDSNLAARVMLPGRPFGAAISPAGVAYVTQLDPGTLARADLPTGLVGSSVVVGRIPTEVVFNSTGTRAYVTNQFNQNVSVVDVSTNTTIDVITVKGDPFEVIVAPGDSILYVTTNLDSVYGIRLATKAQVTSFAVPALANGFAVRDTLLYVGTYEGGTVVEFNLRTRTISRTFSVGGIPQKVALSPDANTLYIANQAGYVQFWNLTTGAQIGSNVPLPGGGGYGIARSPANGLLYVSTAVGGGNIHIIDPTTRTVLKSITVGGSTRRVVFNASGSVGFVTNEGGWVDFLK